MHFNTISARRKILDSHNLLDHLHVTGELEWTVGVRCREWKVGVRCREWKVGGVNCREQRVPKK